jgi:5-methylcytosine-specific restriction endonuclease McrA
MNLSINTQGKERKDEQINIAPLSQLLELLASEFASDADHTSLDKFQKLDGQLDETVFKSKIYHLARRLIVLSEYAVKNSSSSDQSLIIKNAIENIFDMDLLSDPNKFIQLVYECYVQSKKYPSDGEKNIILKKAKDKNENCYICGVTLTFENNKSDTSCEIEHVMPRSLGGGNTQHNLLPSCHKCNNYKKNRIAGADLHYEFMVYPYTEKSKQKITEYHVFASFLFRDSRCSQCGKSAYTQGEMETYLRNTMDAWHLFNIEHLCTQCKITN